MKTVFINGRFLQKPVTGTIRFAREIVWAMDALLTKGPESSAPRVELIAPPGTPEPQGLKRIGFRTCGTHQGHLWEQWDLARATREGVLLSLTNSGPILHPDQIVVVHDALVYRFPQNFTFAYRAFHQMLGRLLARCARLATVSAFSRSELAGIWGLDPSTITLAPNGHEHMLRVEPDERVLDKIGLAGRAYFLFVGSPAPNKNLTRAIEAFATLGRKDVCFVIVGSAKADVFKMGLNAAPPGVLMPGRLSDEEIVTLYRHAQALVFPSLYEGFGIPPLEAMVQGCPVIAADIPPVREVCAEAALYADPHSPVSLTEQMQTLLADAQTRTALIEKGKVRVQAFRWEQGAAVLLQDSKRRSITRRWAQRIIWKHMKRIICLMKFGIIHFTHP